MTTVLLTGSTGHVGRMVCSWLKQRVDVVRLVGSAGQFDSLNTLRVVQADLHDVERVRDVMSQLRPEYLIHLAWERQQANYLQLGAHEQWLEASRQLLDGFLACGGQRAVLAGSCYEHTRPETAYAKAKIALRDHCLQLASAGNSVAWCRIFGVYGSGDRPEKFISSAIRAHIAGDKFVVNTPDARWDYLHVSDVATAVGMTVLDKYSGAVDIASGKSISLGGLDRVIEAVSRGLWKDAAATVNEDICDTLPAVIPALRETIGWSPRFDLVAGIRDTFDADRSG